MSYILRVMDSRKTAEVKRAVWMVAVLVALLLCLSGCSVPEEPPMPTKSAGQQLFHEHYLEINEVVELLWVHGTEFDSMFSEGEDTLHLFSRGWTKEDWRYARTTLTEDEKDRIFSVWNLLDTNALSVTYYQSHPTLAPVIALHCGFDEDGRSFGYYYIRPVNGDDAELTPQETIDKRIVNEWFTTHIATQNGQRRNLSIGIRVRQQTCFMRLINNHRQVI